MIMTNIELVPGREIIEHYGLVQGSTIRAKHAVSDLGATIKNFFGGELKSYTHLLHESREEALERMVNQAQHMGADAIVNIRFSTSSITAGAAEILCYGTAVKLGPK